MQLSTRVCAKLTSSWWKHRYYRTLSPGSLEGQGLAKNKKKVFDEFWRSPTFDGKKEKKIALFSPGDVGFSSTTRQAKSSK
jgi:hypothetical protein